MKLVVSVTPRNLEEAQQIDAQRFVDADLIEWRADFLEKEEIFDLTGRRVESPVKGQVYVKGGKKFIQK